MANIIRMGDEPAPGIPPATKGFLAWDNSLKTFYQVDDVGVRSDLVGLSGALADPVIALVDLTNPPPAALAAGQRYIATAVAAPDVGWGDVSGVDVNDIFERNLSNTTWFVTTDASTAPEGVIVYVADLASVYAFDLSAWNNILDLGTVENLRGFGDGAILETADISVTSDGATVSILVQKLGGGDLTVQFSKVNFVFAPGTVPLTTGTDTSPVLNYIYIEDVAGTATLKTRLSDWPTGEHSPIATVLVQSAAGVLSDGAYKVHAWVNHIASINGHLAHLNRRVREDHALWHSGVNPTTTITVNGGVPDNVDFACLVGTVFQLHIHTFPAVDTGVGDGVYVINDPTTPYRRVTDLNGLLTDSLGVSLTGRYFSLVLWGSIAQTPAESKLYCNLPGGSYGNQASLESDPSKFSDFSIPPEFRGTGFLIAALELRHQPASGGTWTEISTLDLRGLFPTLAAGGGFAQSSEFVDAAFRILDDIDTSKIIAFQADTVTTGTTRTITMPDKDVTLDTAGDPRPPSGAASGDLGTSYPGPTVVDLTMAGEAQGSVLYFNGTNWVQLSAGEASEVLTSQGAGQNPTWSPVGDTRNILAHDHFVTANDDTDEIGLMGWRESRSGTGNDITITGEGGHPGIVVLDPGTGAAGRAALHLGEAAACANIIIGGSNPIVFEALIKFTQSISNTVLEMHQIGLGLEWGSLGELTNGVYVRFDPDASGAFGMVTASGGTRTASLGTTTVVIDTWYRVGFIVSDPGGTPSVQMFVNGSSEGAAITTNVPAVLLGLGMKADSEGVGTSLMLVDYVTLQQDTDKED